MDLKTSLILISVLFANYGNYYNYDVPQELSEQFIQEFGTSQEQLNLLYSVYSVSNIFLSLITSWIINLIGLGVFNILFNSLVFFGTVVVFLGVFVKRYWVILLGRLIFGFGGELSIVAAISILERHFKGGMFSLVNSISISIMLFGVSSSNYLTVIFFNESRDLRYPFVVGSIIAGTCTILASIYSMIFQIEELQEVEEEEDDGSNISRGVVSAADSLLIPHNLKRGIFNKPEKNIGIAGDKTEYINIGDLEVIQEIVEKPTSVRSFLSVGARFFTGENYGEEDITIVSEVESEEVYEKLTFIESLKDLNVRYFYCLGIQLLSGTVYFQFVGLSTELLMNRFKVPLEDTKNMISGMVLLTIITLPIYGFLVNRVGNKPLISIFGGICGVAAFICLYFLPSNPGKLIYIPITLISQFYSLYSTTINPMLSLSLPSRTVSFGLAIAVMGENIGLTVTPLITGWIISNYTISEFNHYLILMGSLCLVKVFLCTSLFIYDLRNGGLLKMKEDDNRVESIRRNMTLENNISISGAPTIAPRDFNVKSSFARQEKKGIKNKDLRAKEA